MYHCVDRRFHQPVDFFRPRQLFEDRSRFTKRSVNGGSSETNSERTETEIKDPEMREKERESGSGTSTNN